MVLTINNLPIYGSFKVRQSWRESIGNLYLSIFIHTTKTMCEQKTEHCNDMLLVAQALVLFTYFKAMVLYNYQNTHLWYGQIDLHMSKYGHVCNSMCKVILAS